MVQLLPLLAQTDAELLGCPLLWTVSFAVITTNKATSRSDGKALSASCASICQAQDDYLLVCVSTDTSEDLSVANLIVS
jgi:hypothetical protein